ncbi:CLUMA_CG008024, isoform A [Clunio marinus]|uniref:CLUMA_CG008024, isoform A n=1 Tax=Clunio marinus TaxID=568069 RepID=A0A1J1I2F1_9DIPT|nr:CLUMA_CG008024, isoform A [Clunio marinus]
MKDEIPEVRKIKLNRLRLYQVIFNLGQNEMNLRNKKVMASVLTYKELIKPQSKAFKDEGTESLIRVLNFDKAMNFVQLN